MDYCNCISCQQHRYRPLVTFRGIGLDREVFYQPVRTAMTNVAVLANSIRMLGLGLGAVDPFYDDLDRPSRVIDWQGGYNASPRLRSRDDRERGRANPHPTRRIQSLARYTCIPRRRTKEHVPRYGTGLLSRG